MSGARARWSLALLALACIGLQFPGWLSLSAAAALLWLVALAAFDREALRRLWMPRFWTVTVVFALASGLLLGQRDLTVWGLGLSSVGLRAGALMVLRGVLIFGLAMWASRNLNEGAILRAARRIGLAPLGAAVPVALRLLPELQQEYRRARREHHGYGLAVELLCQTARLAGRLAGERPAVFAVTGAPGVGKSTTVRELARRLREQGLAVGGVLQPAVHEQGKRVGYRLRDVASGEERAFARRREGPVAPGEVGFVFDEQGWAWARERIRAARREAEVVVVDELGRLEARGEGHLPALIEPQEADSARVLLLAVRADQAPAVLEQLGGAQHRLELPAAEPEQDKLVVVIGQSLVSSGATEVH